MHGIFKKKSPGHITITLNAKLQPMHRADLEDAFDEICQKHGIEAEVVGGGTLQEENGEVKECDIEIALKDLNEKTIETVKGLFESMLAPKGSYMSIEGQGKVSFGKHEGLGLYLNGSDLPEEIYKSCDSNFVYQECERLLEGIATVDSHWQGPTETAIYMYGKNFKKIERAIKPLIESYPLCQKCRVVRIA
jgi:hypothetical protein